MGYTLFAIPGIVGLIPDGKNADGSNRCIAYTLDKVHLFNYSSSYTRDNQPFFVGASESYFGNTAGDRYYPYNTNSTADGQTYVTYYDTNKNIMYHSDSTAGVYTQIPCFFGGYIKLTNGVCSNIRIQPVADETKPLIKAVNY